jgi:hypothetical protein
VFLTIIGCVVAVIAIKLLFRWVSRPRTNVHVHIAAPDTLPIYYPVPVIVNEAASSAEALSVEDDAELHEMIDDYYREHGPR